MLSRINELEEALGAISVPSLIGHNNPPEAIAAEEVSRAAIEEINEEHFKEIRSSVEVIKSQPERPVAKPKAAVAAAETLASVSTTIGIYLATKGDLFLSEAVKSAGKETGKWATRAAVLTLLADALLRASGAIMQWVDSVLSHIR